MAAGSITFLSAPQIRPGGMHERKKKELRRRTDREAEAERKVRSKGKSCTKTNSCNPKVTMTDESSKEGLRWPVWTGGSRSFAVFEQYSGRESSSATVQTPFGESDMHRLSKQGVPDRLIMATPGNKSFESTKIDSRRTPSTIVGGCLAGRRPLFGRQKETCQRLARQNGEAAKTSRIDSLRFLVYTRWSLQHSNQSTMCKLQGHVGTAIQALGFRLDLAASRPRRCAPRSGFARSSPHPRAGLKWSCSMPVLTKNGLTSDLVLCTDKEWINKWSCSMHWQRMDSQVILFYALTKNGLTSDLVLCTDKEWIHKWSCSMHWQRMD